MPTASSARWAVPQEHRDPGLHVRNYGADTFRLYEMSMGPLDESRPWNTRNVVGGMRFLQRLAQCGR